MLSLTFLSFLSFRLSFLRRRLRLRLRESDVYESLYDDDRVGTVGSAPTPFLVPMLQCAFRRSRLLLLLLLLLCPVRLLLLLLLLLVARSSCPGFGIWSRPPSSSPTPCPGSPIP